MAIVSSFIEKLHAKVSSHHEKELITARVLGIAKAQKEARTVIGSHAQAMPLFVSILRDGTLGAKLNVAATLCVMCKDDDLRVKVLLGGCIPPLLSLLKSESHEARKAASEAIYEVSSGALRNLCVMKDSYWQTILEAGGAKTIIKLLSSDNNVAQSNAASLLASLMLTFSDIIAEVIDPRTIKSLLELLEQNNDIYVRVSAAEALEAITCKSEDARKDILDANGAYLLIGAAQEASSSEKHQECAVELLLILTDQVDDSKWAITSAGGIPPLVQLLETGSQKATDCAALLLWNLCCHSEDIHACVESAGGVSAFIWLLKSGGSKGQDTSVKALLKLIRTADPAAINQLLPLLQDESIDSKSHIIRVLGHILTLTSEKDLTHTESAANKAITSLVQVLNSPNRKTQEYAAYILADLLTTRQDICHSLSSNEIADPCKMILNGNNTESVVKQLAQALSALSRPKKTKSSKKMTNIVDKDVKPLINLAKTSPIDSAASVVAALANILSDPHVAAEALTEGVVSALIRVLGEGNLQGKKSASQALTHLLRHFPVTEVLSGSDQCRFVILSVLESLSSMEKKGTDVTDSLEVVSLLIKTNQGANLEVLLEAPSRLEPLVYCLAKGSPTVQDKAIEILSRIYGEQPVMLGDLLIARSNSIGALANRITNSPSSEVKVSGTALLICVAKEHRHKSLEEIDTSGYLKPLIFNLVNMVKHNSRFSSLEIEIQSPLGFYERSIRKRREEFDKVDRETVLGGTAALWLLAIINSFGANNKLITKEAGGLEVLSNKLSYYTSRPQASLKLFYYFYTILFLYVCKHIIILMVLSVKDHSSHHDKSGGIVEKIDKRLGDK
ncbi:Protein CELLULOSE SYNTHASE INTERACTIVE 3 [Linum grandiflorum]